MGSIFGYFNKKGSKEGTQEAFERMLKWNVAYGEADSMNSFFYSDVMCFGTCNERVSELIPFGRAIYEVEDKIYGVDALLYNREELCENSSSYSDEELLVNYIEDNGLTALKEVNGDFAGFLYNKKSNTLTLFRDQIGIRPLFAYKKDSVIAFATDIRGLIAIKDTDTSLSDHWLYSAGMGYMTTDIVSTEYEFIDSVRPGAFLEIDLSTFEEIEHSYFKLAEKKIRYASDLEYIKHFRELIEDAIRRRLSVTNQKVGAELSGGLDSGVIDILIHRMGRECLYHSWSYDAKEVSLVENDERLIIEDICKQEAINCHYVSLKDDLPEVKDLLYPLYSNTTQLTVTGKYMKENGVKVIFTGHGGDEGVSHRSNAYEMFNYGEYGNYLSYHWESTKGEKLRSLHTLWRAYKNLKYMKLSKEGNGTSFFKESTVFTKDFLAAHKDIKLERHSFGYDPVNYVNRGGSQNRLMNLALQGAASGVRYCIPYLDYRVIDYALSIPRNMYLRYGENRYIFREAFKDIMPESLYILKTKMDFSYNSPDLEDKRSKEEQAKELVTNKTKLINQLKQNWGGTLDFDYLGNWAAKESEDLDGEDFGIAYYLSMLELADTLEKELKK